MKLNSVFKLFIISIVLILFIKITPSGFNFYGEKYLAQANYKHALEFFNTALLFSPQNNKYRYNYIKTLSKLEPTYYVQKEVFRISESKKLDSAQRFASDLVNKWRHEIIQRVGDNYIEQSSSGTVLIRWSNDSFPLKVYLDNASLSKLPNYYKNSILNSFAQWDQAVDFLSFEMVDNPSDANILIQFKPLPSNVCSANVCKYVIGYTSPSIKNGELKYMLLTLYERNHLGRFFSEKELYNTVLHELGHALGIMGHSYNSNDLMYQEAKEHNSLFAKYRSDFMYLSYADVNTIKLLYMLEPNVTNKVIEDKSNLVYTPVVLGNSQEIAHRKLKEASYYVKKSPDLAIGYLNMASALEQLNQDKKAIKALHTAEKLAKDNGEKKVIYNNLAVIYSKIEDYENANKYLKMSQKL